MNTKPAFFISAALSVFILALVAGVVAYTAQPAAPSAEIVAQPLVGYSEAEINQLLAVQESAYTQVVEAANQQLSEAQSVIDSMQASPADANPSTSVSASSALEMAIAVSNGSTNTGAAELVNFEGATAFEVPFAAGNIYVDAQSGSILHNGTIVIVPADISPERAAQLASAYMGKNDVFKVVAMQLNNEDVYRVKFDNGDAVFVSLKGDLLLVRLAATAQTAGGYGTEYEHDEEHEDDDYDDD
jgi:uncharacterized membrane protein YkoI